ncbi:SRPBCC family protein [Acidicapsa acidisoli]|uniref:SRPBCC family protein n=1 Tax=Acidicapsa acidisoli TaxID=1615681 RepID=UPI0021E0635F|nr:SRPBCC family protein [Acidicapsa acidisoli]
MSTTQETPVSTMPATAESAPPVRKNVRVRANAARAFRVFTEGLDTWWPKTHHIGKSPMTKAVMEGRVGGRCYSDQEDGTQCDWGQILVWEPPTRFVMAWQVTPAWQFEPDLAKCSEVEVTFTPSEDGTTWVELEHRHFERHGDGGGNMRNQVDQPGGWSQLMELFRTEAERED